MSDEKIYYSTPPRCGKTFLLKEKIKQYERGGKKIKVMDKVEPVPTSLFPDEWWSVIRFQEENFINTDELFELLEYLKK